MYQPVLSTADAVFKCYSSKEDPTSEHSKYVRQYAIGGYRYVHVYNYDTSDMEAMEDYVLLQ